MPAPDSQQYRDFVSAFYVGLAGLQTGEDVRAKQKLTLATQIAPGEPAAWADLAVFAVRQQEFEAALQYAAKARALAPGNSRIEALLGLIESRRGNVMEAIAHLRKAVDLDGGNLKALYALAEETQRKATTEGEAETQKALERLLQRQPGNIAVQLDLTRTAARRGDRDTVKRTVARLAEESAGWPDEVRRRVAALQQAVAVANPRAAGVAVAFLRNVLVRVPAYRQSLNAVKTPAAFGAEPFVRLLKLPAPASEPSPADADLRMTAEPLSDQEVLWAGALVLNDSGKPYVLLSDSRGVQIVGGARLPASGGPNGILGADLNYDFKADLVIAGPQGVRIFQQGDPAHFTAIALKLPPGARYSGAWAFDVDLDGDLDVVLGVAGGEPLALRNNGDNTFAVVRPFPGVSGLVAFAGADIDGDGDPDVAMIDGGGNLHLFTNERLGAFRAQPTVQGRFAALTAGDVNADGMPDFVALRQDGSVIRLAGQQTVELAKPGGSGAPNLLLADLDNNGSLDLVAGNRILLGGAEIALPAGAAVTGAVDLNNDGRLDLIGVQSGKPVRFINHGSRNYNWQVLRFRAARATGDQRINSFGIGGEVEIRSGLLTQKQIITSPVLHFGLGDRTRTDVARIVWPNGLIQAEFELKSDQSLLAEQRLKGSCPSLFAWDGRRISFVKDGAPWSPALGLHINAQVVAGIYQTQEWFKIPGESLVARDGVYDVRVTAELWETYYIDHFSLLVVDHPRDTEIFTDERFSVPPPALRVYTVSPRQPFAYAKDDRGEDVSDIVRTLDRRYLDTFGRGRYQGVTRDHWVEAGLPDSAPRKGPLYLIGDGWMHPTDATVNIALGQNSDPPPRGLSIEVPDEKGRWITAKSGLGFLAGKYKTAVLDISGVFRPGVPRKLRLRTNMEIYWDRLAWAAGAPDSRAEKLSLAKADLRYRGFSVMKAANASSPETPDYNQIEGTAPKWRDLEGYCTRYGDVRELLERIDDRIVIMNAGDELRLAFPARSEPPAGWVRDFVMVGDGWIKDGDYNSVYSKTVLPLPWHGMKDYTQPPGALEDDPAYRMHPRDWDLFHNRYVTPEPFVRALWN